MASKKAVKIKPGDAEPAEVESEPVVTVEAGLPQDEHGRVLVRNSKGRFALLSVSEAEALLSRNQNLAKGAEKASAVALDAPEYAEGVLLAQGKADGVAAQNGGRKMVYEGQGWKEV